ncbi:FAD-binding domain-containing protein [Penicillium capsulatum]|uniref:FAD-binding domain-containing protein n=1 Tax=Penicillium capsulatum TaxID=69766 RepID=A0A9W9HZN6_9EURO|nr:FAD-binding domain-containing protein [Penicillium capsulatum]KAJ6116441.1 FAD-binding domain-containing protein [Penicillium capsulatum]
MFFHIASVLFLALALKVAWPLPSLTQHAACVLLSVQLPGAVHYPGSTKFSDSLASYFTKQEQETQPTCIVEPNSPSQVSRFVHTMSQFVMVGGRFAVRSGGHATFSAAANIQNGLVLSLSLLDQVQVQDDRSVVSLGPGARWGDVWQVLDPLGITVAGGRDAGVGVGGYLLGGGLSYLGPTVGWGCDTVLEFEVVLANGEVVTASENSHPDLFLALKGGTNNFGIVTKFTMQTYPLKSLWGGFIVHRPDAAPKQVEALSDFMGAEPYDPHAAMFQSYAFMSGNKFISNSVTYTKPVTNPKVFKDLVDPTTVIHDALRMGNMGSFANETSQMQSYNTQQTWFTTTFAHTPSIYSTVHSIWEDSIPGIANIPGINWCLTVQPAPALGHKNSLGLDSKEKRLAIIIVTVNYNNSADISTVRAAVEQLIASVEAATKAAGVYRPYKYLNYADGSQDVISGYGPASKANLQATSKKYDPHGLFQRGLPGGFKVFT